MKIETIGIALAAFEPNSTYFAEQLRSIQDQDFTDWICFIGFDSSLANIIDDQQISVFRHDSRFHFFENKERLGFKQNFMLLARQLAKQSVDAIAFADQDDIWLKNKLFLQREILESLPPYSLVHSDLYLLVEGKRQRRSVWQVEERNVEANAPEHLLVRNNITGCSILMDVRLAKEYGNAPKSVPFHDQWFAIIAASRGKIYSLDQPLLEYRQHEQNQVGSKTPAGLLKAWRESEEKGTSTKQITVSHWLESLELVLALLEQKLPLTKFLRKTYISKDFGLRFFWLAIRYYRWDKHLAKAYFVRGLGKFWSKI